MGASFLITLREGLEISLVLAILLAYLDKSGRRELFRPVAVGAGFAAIVCIIAGVAFHLAVGEFEGKAEQAIEGSLAVVACGVLTWMIFWMRKNARGMSKELHGRLDAAAERSRNAVMSVAFAAVAREGFETALFLLSAENGNSSAATVITGGLLGLVVAAVLGVFVYQRGTKVDLRSFFLVTGALLVLFAAGLAGKAVHEFRELLEIEGWLATPVWTITSGPLATDWTYDFLKGLFGWSSNPERVRVFAYLAYLIPVGYLFLAGSKPARQVESAAPSAANEGQAVGV